MRLLLIASEFPPGPGGIGNHAYYSALNLHRLGWDLLVAAPQDYAAEEELEGFNSKLPFRVVRFASGRGQLREAISRLRICSRLAREQRPDVMFGTGLSGVWVSTALSLMRRLPMLAVAHGSEFARGSRFARVLNRRAFERADVVVAVSQFTRGVVESVGIRPRRIEVIPNAADLSGYQILAENERERFRQRAGFNGARLLLAVGHVNERKGQEVVIRALPQILKKVPQAHYLMIGLPTLKPELSRLAEKLGVADRVHFLGRVAEQEKVRWLNCCDVFLMTSRTTVDGDCEGYGIAVVEAALCGRPAVVSNGSGIIEAIQNGVTGLAVPEGDASATAAAVVSLLTEPALLDTMGKAAYDRALREQTWDICSRKYDALLRSLTTDH